MAKRTRETADQLPATAVPLKPTLNAANRKVVRHFQANSVTELAQGWKIPELAID